ncbi:hypothetical protein OO013_10310 [Mangrovivirga sp. M17]|uniref:Uncharacterized protein n=1 Tax=Mangrovivirga halotolerans TaxID=2993936 RepID=A0ABT3RRZ8_9BACT|nr:hypothetical protein [Mangrovivirga halotolerans]MCX2744261.1 hypothetical protein [Mangrovivirga halotolerans]
MGSIRFFRTQNGFCYLNDEEIIVSDKDSASIILANDFKLTKTFNLLFYGVFSIGMLFLAYEFYKSGKLIPVGIFTMVSIYFAYGLFDCIINVSIKKIQKKNISHVSFHKGITGLTRSKFVIHFTDEEDKERKRNIYLADTLFNMTDYNPVIDLLKDAGYLDDDQL